MEFRKNYEKELVPGKTFYAPSFTQQQFKNECDVNLILKRYEQTGVIDHLTAKKPLYGDFSDIPDYQIAQHILIDAQEKFDALPASIRKRFDNNPLNMVEFCKDPKNHEEGVKLGLFVEVNEEPVMPSSEPLVPDGPVSSSNIPV